MTRYTIVGNGTNHFKLVEDKDGVWMQSAEVLANLPRCETCHFWRLDPPVSTDYGFCLLSGAGSQVFGSDGEELIMTLSAFGCVQWKGKTGVLYNASITRKDI